MIKFTLTKNNYPELIKKLSELDNEDFWEITIKKFDPKRSLDSNDFYWKLITAMADYFGVSNKEEMHDVMKYNYLSERKEIKGKKIITIKSTSDLNQKEFNEYVSKVKNFAIDHGFLLDEY